MKESAARNPLLIPLIVVSALFVLMVVGIGVYASRQRHESSHVLVSQPVQPKSIAVVEPVPAKPAPIPKFTISEETKTQIARFLEKAGKLKAMTDQGIRLDEFNSQLSEVKGSWESMATLGLPEELKAEKELLETALSSWALAQEIWAGQMKASLESRNKPGEDVLFMLRAGKRYGGKLDTLVGALRTAAIATTEKEDFSNKRMFEADVVVKLMSMADLMIQQIELGQGPNEIDVKVEQFTKTLVEIRRVVQQVFGDGDIPKTLRDALDGDMNITEAITKIGEKVGLLRSERQTAFADANTKVQLAQIKYQWAEIEAKLAQAALATAKGTSGAPVPQDRDGTGQTVSPQETIKWCLAGGGKALEEAKKGISARIQKTREQ